MPLSTLWMMVVLILLHLALSGMSFFVPLSTLSMLCCLILIPSTMSAKLSKDELRALLKLNLKHCQPMCKEEHFDKGFFEHLILAQKMAGFQFVVTSGFRSKEWETVKGRDGSSSHCRYDKDGNAASLAADISTPDSFTRFKVVFAAGLAGIPRIGIGKNFIHLDMDLKKAHPIIFHYYE